MKKLVTFFVGLLLTVSMVHSQAYWDQYLINENFDGRVALPTGWSFINGNTTGVFGRNAGISYVDGVKMSAAGSGNRGGEVQFVVSPDSSTIYVEMDLKVDKSVINYRNTFQFFLLGSKSRNLAANDGTQFADVIAGLYWVGSSGKFHVWNRDVKGLAPIDPVTELPTGDTIPVFTTGQYPGFNRAGVSLAASDSLNLSTITDVTYAYNEWFNLVFKLDFVNKKVDVTITQLSNPENTQTITDLDFITPTSTDVVRFGMLNNRASNQGNASNADLDATVDNFKVYQKVLSLGNADVTIIYQDTEGNTIKDSRIEQEQEVGLEYFLKSSDMESFIANDFYYSFDPVATGAQSIVVQSGGSTIIVKFKKAPVTAGTYVWKGYASNLWSEQDANFTTDNVNQLSYQFGNAVSFSDASAPITDITLEHLIDLGEADMVIDAPGYIFRSTAGFVSGTGSIEVNASTTLGLINKLAGPVKLNKDTLNVINTMSINNSIVAKDGTSLKSNVGLGSPIKGDGGVFNLIPGVVAYTSPISGFEQVNFSMQARGNYVGQSGTPRMNLVLDSLMRINVSTIHEDTTLYDTWTNYVNNKMHLGNYIYKTYSPNPNADGSTIFRIGELTGDEGSVLVGPRLRLMSYHVGSLNTDATYNGSFAPFVRDAWDNMTTYNIVKVGTGTWTLAGNSPNYFGAVRVLNGTLKVDGLLSDMQGEYLFAAGATVVPKQISEVLVADTATLAGSGFLGANVVNVNGTITGSLEIGGSLILKPDYGDGGATTIINVNATRAEKIKVTGDLYYGGTLKVMVDGTYPQPGSYQIFEFGSYIESGLFGFDFIELPSANWTFDFETGMLAYAGGDNVGVNETGMTREIESTRYFDISGREVTKHHEGFVMVKVKYTDGSTASFKTFVRK